MYAHAPGAAGVFRSSFDPFENDATGVRGCRFCSGISTNGESTGIDSSVIVRFREPLKRSRGNSIVLGCGVDFNLISRRLIDATMDLHPTLLTLLLANPNDNSREVFSYFQARHRSRFITCHSFLSRLLGFPPFHLNRCYRFYDVELSEVCCLDREGHSRKCP